VSGVVGTLLELVEVEPGWEAAFEAAAGDALGAGGCHCSVSRYGRTCTRSTLG
jgi:hypothetical protein